MRQSKHGFPNLSHKLVVGLGLILLSSCGLIPTRSPTPLPGIPTPPPFNVAGERQLTDDEFLYQNPVWSPDGKTIAVQRNTATYFGIITGPYDIDWEIVLVQVESSDLSVIETGDDSINIGPTWSPDGTQLAFTTREFSSISNGDHVDYLTIYSLSDGSWIHYECITCSDLFWLKDGTILLTFVVEMLSENERQFSWGRIDPDTGEMVSQTPIAGTQDVFIITASGDRVLSATALIPAPDENVFLVGVGAECTGIWRYTLGSEGPEPFIDSSEFYECDPAWSWNSMKIAYTLKNPFALDPTYLVISDADGSNSTNFIEPQTAYYQIRDPAWSHDGSNLAFVYGIVSSEYTELSDSNLFIVDVPPDLQP